jgi:hypothetical protein
MIELIIVGTSTYNVIHHSPGHTTHPAGLFYTQISANYLDNNVIIIYQNLCIGLYRCFKCLYLI